MNATNSNLYFFETPYINSDMNRKLSLLGESRCKLLRLNGKGLALHPLYPLDIRIIE